MAPGAVVKAEAQTLRQACGGGDAVIEGNHNTVVLNGACHGLLLKGVGNTVAIELQAGAVVRLEGSENRITFHALAGPPPVLQIAGPDNVAEAGDVPPAPAVKVAEAPAAMPAPKPVAMAGPPVRPVSLAEPAPKAGLLTFSGDDQQRDEDCAGRQVVIQGNRSAYVLRGGCQSVSVRGDLDLVQAELRPAAHVGITGHGTIVSWALMGRGKDPSALIHGEGNRVQRIATIGGEPVR
ncbi:MAG: DUF3060 domain-containing protein [Acetobacteraceae bacterium]